MTFRWCHGAVCSGPDTSVWVNRVPLTIVGSQTFSGKGDAWAKLNLGVLVNELSNAPKVA